MVCEAAKIPKLIVISRDIGVATGGLVKKAATSEQSREC
jgi:hypothetical protein